MAKMSTGRILFGGIVAGIVADAISYAVDGKLLAGDWSDGMLQLGRPELSRLQFLGIVTGIVLIWIYAAFLPRFGPGAFTAIYAAIAVWIVAVLIPNLSLMWIGGLFPHRLTAETTVGGLLELIIGGIAGAILYKDQPPSPIA